MEKEYLYVQTIKDAYPNLEIDSARLHSGEGQFNDIVFINDDLIFRFPRYAEGIHDLLQEIEVLQKLQGHLSITIPDPIYLSSGTEFVGQVFMGYKLLPGKPLLRDALRAIAVESILESLAQQLADFLYGLHSLSPAALGLELSVHNSLAELKEFFSSVQEHLFPWMRPDARSAVTRHFEDYLKDAYSHEYQASMIHGDFGGSNILFDHDKITGVIDFSFAGLGDPARDIAAVSTYGEAFFARICRHYPNIESLLERAKFYRGTFALYEALHGFRHNDREAFASGMEQYV